MGIDIALIVVVLIGLYYGYKRGIINTVFTILSLLIGVAAAMKFTPLVSTQLTLRLGLNVNLMPIISFIITFLIAMLIVRLIAKLLEGVLKKIELNSVNRLAGAVLFCGITVFLYSALLVFLVQAQVVPIAATEQSVLYPYLEVLPKTVYSGLEQVLPFVRNFWEYILESFDKVESVPIQSE